MHEFRKHAYSRLETQDPTISTSLSYYDKLLSSVLDEGFRLQRAAPLDEGRWRVTKETIERHFNLLQEAGVLDCEPSMIINIDETGFGASKSGRMKPKKVIVPNEFTGIPVYQEELASHFLTSLSAISLSGDALFPALISARQSDHPDASSCSFYPFLLRYESENAFVTRDIFNCYLGAVVIPYFEAIRLTPGRENWRGFIIFDGHKSHLCDLANAICAENNITLYLLPPHSSHLCQPLDRGYFRKLKSCYARERRIPGLSKISCMLERIYGALQAASVIRTIWNSWEASGFLPTIEQGRCVGFTLKPELVLDRDALHHVAPPVKEGQIGRKVNSAEFGVLNEDEMLIYEAGQCPFCCQPLD
jgi:hypothetical protein